MKNILLGISMTLLVAGCSPSSIITSSWKKPKFAKSYSDVIVVAMTPSVEAKRAIENDLATALVGRGAAVSKGLDLFPPSFTKDTKKEEMMARIRRSASKAIVTVSLIHKETSSNYNAGSYGYAPGYIYRGPFWGYYSYWYPTIYSPGYYTENQVYYMETNVYDAATEDLVWSAQSESYNPSDISGFSTELANLITDKLFKDGIVKSKGLDRPDKKALTSRNRR